MAKLCECAAIPSARFCSLSVPRVLHSNRSISSFFDEYDSFTAMPNRTIALAWVMCTAFYIAVVHDFVGDTLHSYDNISYRIEMK